MFFREEDYLRLKHIECMLAGMLSMPDDIRQETLYESVGFIEETIKRLPDIEKFCESIRNLVEYEQSNIKALNQMMCELKGIIASHRSEIVDLCETKKGVTNLTKDFFDKINEMHKIFELATEREFDKRFNLIEDNLRIVNQNFHNLGDVTIRFNNIYSKIERIDEAIERIESDKLNKMTASEALTKIDIKTLKAASKKNKA